MCLLFETVKILEGQPQHLHWHHRRMKVSAAEFRPGALPIDLPAILNVPQEFRTGVVRCNIRYDSEIREITFNGYKKRSISTLKLVQAHTLDYHVKYHDRSSLEALFALRGSCDEILIVKNYLVTDTSMSNIIFSDGIQWFTPATPLLRGTCRERLIDEKRVVECIIRPQDLPQFKEWKLINAMRDPDDQQSEPVSSIFW